ncbi:MAG TPA: DUF3450 domain-containing protein [Gammaproteobacteria bacterium]|nr:DUF3450 domain-containing protein [Gammaproteobacteria bacterium]
MRLFSSITTSRANARPRAALQGLPAFVAAFAVVAALASASAGAQQSQVDKTINAQAQADKAAAASQKRIDTLSDRTDQAAQKYAQTMDEAESLEKYNKQLGDQVAAQEEQIASIQKQLDGIEETNREVQPLMQQMIQSLDQFVSLDVPFLKKEREARAKNLENIMQRADVTISEKYRQILEAYQSELDYGNRVGAYRGELGTGDQARTVQFVWIGRISFMYQTLDGTETGYWDQHQRKWVVDNSYADAFKVALKVASSDGSPELLTLPVPAPEEIHS